MDGGVGGRYGSGGNMRNVEQQIKLHLLAHCSQIREAFRVLDRDGNGFISKQELGMAMRSLGYMPSEVELAIIMQRLDMDEILGLKGLSKESEDLESKNLDSFLYLSFITSIPSKSENVSCSVVSNSCLSQTGCDLPALAKGPERSFLILGFFFFFFFNV
ncbi:hypothetical protein FD755_025919, partial [Muntiacus reevesi]